MNPLIERFSNVIKGCITGFDRIVFKGLILPLAYAKGAMSFCRSNKILNKDYKKWMLEQTELLIEAADQYAKTNCGSGIIPISSWRIRKEELAHERQERERIEKGLLGVWSCLEAGSSYRAHYSAQKGYPELKNYRTRCKHLYFYFDNEEFGFMNIRLQTWFPYHIQICLNGREWLKRHLEGQGVDFTLHRNKFLDIGDYQEAQRLFDMQLDARWPQMLNGFLGTVFPMMPEILGPHLSYYWTMWQSEWATDLIFKTPGGLNSIKDALLRHAFITGTSTRVLRYMDRPLSKEGIPYIRSKDEVSSRILDFNDGLRVRHYVDNNSVKVYNEQNVLRVEMTMNRPEKFRVYRNKQGEPPSEPKKRLTLRKGVADIPLRAQVSQEVNERFMRDLSNFHDDTPFCKLIDNATRSRTKKGRRTRALDPTGKDRELLQVISDPAYRVSGVTNKMLRERFKHSPWASNRTDKQISARISRLLRLLRDHGIIRKLPNQNRYQLSDKGAKLTTALNAALAASIEQLMKMAA